METKKTVITVHAHKYGPKEYEFDADIKRLLYIGLFALLSFLAIIFFVIVYLSESLSVSREEEQFVKSEYEKMKEMHTTLYETMTHVQQDLLEKEEALSRANVRMSNIEERMGMTPAKEKILDKRLDKLELSVDEIAPLMRYIPNGSPIEYKGITSRYGSRIHPKLKKREFHKGTDMKASMKTPIYAPADAVVEYTGYNKKSGYGRLIILSHNYGFRTFYGHLNKIAVKTADFIKKGDLIGYTGNSGLSTAPHLHYEIRFLQHTVNPYWFIKWNVKNYKEIFTKVKRVPWKSLIKAVSESN